MKQATQTDKRLHRQMGGFTEYTVLMKQASQTDRRLHRQMGGFTEYTVLSMLRRLGPWVLRVKWTNLQLL
jgi:hypothetical protein